jgi:hypothetical protein
MITKARANLRAARTDPPTQATPTAGQLLLHLPQLAKLQAHRSTTPHISSKTVSPYTTSLINRLVIWIDRTPQHEAVETPLAY